MALGTEEPDEPGKVLGLLHAAFGFGCELADFMQLVIGNRYGHQAQVLDAPLPVGSDKVVEQAELGCEQLARPRTPAFDVPFKAEPLLREIAQILPKNELVDGVALGVPANEHAARLARERSHWPERQVDAAKRGRDRKPVVCKGDRCHGRVQV